MTASLERLRIAQKEWLQDVQTRTRKSLTEISRVAGFSPSTLTRFFNDRGGHQGALSSLTIIRVSEATGIPATASILGQGGPSPKILLQREAEVFEPNDCDLGMVFGAYANGRPSLQLWRLTTPLLSGAGYFPNDVMILNTAAVPVEGDIVCAEITNRGQYETQMVWRIFEPPYITARPVGIEPAKPRLVDGESVMIIGVVEAMVRPRWVDRRN